MRPEARDALLITLLILLLTRQHVSTLGPGDGPSESALIPKPLGHEGQPKVWQGRSHCGQNCGQQALESGRVQASRAEHLGKPFVSRCFLLSCSPLDPPCPASVETCQSKLQAKQAQASGPRHTQGSLLRKASQRWPDLFLSSSPGNHADGILSVLSGNLLLLSFSSLIGKLSLDLVPTL